MKVVGHKITSISGGTLPTCRLDLEPGLVRSIPDEKLQRLLIEESRPNHGTHVSLIIMKQVQVQVRGGRQELGAGGKICQHSPHSLQYKVMECDMTSQTLACQAWAEGLRLDKGELGKDRISKDIMYQSMPGIDYVL